MNTLVSTPATIQDDKGMRLTRAFPETALRNNV
jgi:hypothetical protein